MDNFLYVYNVNMCFLKCVFSESTIYASSIKFVTQTFDNIKKTFKIRTDNSYNYLLISALIYM